MKQASFEIPLCTGMGWLRDLLKLTRISSCHREVPRGHPGQREPCKQRQRVSQGRTWRMLMILELRNSGPLRAKPGGRWACYRERGSHKAKTKWGWEAGDPLHELQSLWLRNLQGSPSIFSSLQTSCSNSDPTFTLLLPAATVRW